MRLRHTMLAAFLALLSIFALPAVPSAYAQDDEAVQEGEADEAEQGGEGEEEEEECPSDSIPTSKILLTLGTLVVVSGAMAGVGVMTWSRSLAAGGHRQSSANIAGMGLGPLIGGGVSALLFAGQCDTVALWPGFVSIGVAVIGLFMVFAGALSGKD